MLKSQEIDESHNMQGGVPVKFPATKHHSREVRVDYVQHAMSGMIAYEKLLLAETHRKRLGFNISMPRTPIETNGFPLLYMLVVILVSFIGIAVFSSKKKKKGNKTY